MTPRSGSITSWGVDGCVYYNQLGQCSAPNLVINFPSKSDTSCIYNANQLPHGDFQPDLPQVEPLTLEQFRIELLNFADEQKRLNVEGEIDMSRLYGLTRQFANGLELRVPIGTVEQLTEIQATRIRYLQEVAGSQQSLGDTRFFGQHDIAKITTLDVLSAKDGPFKLKLANAVELFRQHLDLGEGEEIF